MSMVRLAALASLLGIAGATPQAATPSLEEIIAELEGRLASLGPVYVRAVVDAKDLGAAAKTRYELEIHYRPGEFWMHSILRDVQPGGAEVFRLYEKDEAYLVWEAGKDGDRVDNGPYYKWYWKANYELDGELAKILGTRPEAKSLADFTAGVKPELYLDLRSESVDSPKSRVFVSMDRSRGGGASWIENLRWAAADDIVVTADEVIARFPAMAHETVIDRKTGFLKSIDNNFTTGDRRTLTVKELKTGVKKPEVKKPAKSRTRKLESDDIAGGVGQFLVGYLHECLPRMLKNWETAGAPAKADALRGFLTLVAARRGSLVQDSWHRNWAQGWLKGQRRDGRSIEEIAKNLDKCALELQAYIESADERYFDVYRGHDDELKKALLGWTREGPGTGEARALLAKRIEEAFDRDRLEKARAKLPPTDYRGLLRDAIEEAARKK